MSPETMWKPITHAAADCNEQESFFYSGIDLMPANSMRDPEGFCDKLFPNDPILPLPQKETV